MDAWHVVETEDLLEAVFDGVNVIVIASGHAEGQRLCA